MSNLIDDLTLEYRLKQDQKRSEQSIAREIAELQAQINSLQTRLNSFVLKAGDTMTGDLLIDRARLKLSSEITDNVEPEVNFYGRSIDLNDASGNNIGGIGSTFLPGVGQGCTLYGRRSINGSNHDNFVRLLVDSSGNEVVRVSDAAAWRAALGFAGLANGLKVAYGRTTSSASDVITISYGKTFSSNPVVFCEAQGSATGSVFDARPTSVGTSNFKAHVIRVSGSGSNTAFDRVSVTLNWLAIGV